jgi:hypothetical protein
VLGALDGQLARRPRRGIELDALRPLALDDFLEPEEDFRVDGLRAGIAAPQAAGDGGEQEQGQRADDHQQHEVDRVLRPQHQVEEVELACVDVEQDGLPVAPRQPAQAVENDLRQPDENPAPAGVDAADRARVHLGLRIGPGLDLDDFSGCRRP